MRAVTARALAPGSGYDPRGGRRPAASSSRPWSSVPTLHGSSWSTPSSGTPRVCARRRSRSRSAVSATSTTSTTSTREGEGGDARENVPGATAPSPTRGADADASTPNRDGDLPGRDRLRSLTPGQRRAAEKKAIHAKRHPNGHDAAVSLHLRAKAKARRGDKQGALEELKRGAARFPKNAHIGVSLSRALADDFDAADGDGEKNALRDALWHLDALERATSGSGEIRATSKSVMYQLRGVLEARRLELANADPALFAGEKASGEREPENGESFPSARRARAAFEASVALDPQHWAAWHAWGVFEMRRGRANKARRLLREARRSDPRRARTAQTLAALEASAGAETGGATSARDFHAARSLFQEAIALDATHAPSYTAWARMEQRAGNLTRAARVFRRGEEATRNAARDAHAYRVTVTKSRRDDVDGDPLFSRSALLAAYGAFEARRAPGSAKARSHARTLFREACDTCRRNPRAFAAWAAAETAFERHDDAFRASPAKRTPGPGRGPEHAPNAPNALSVLAEGLDAHPGNERLLHARACALRAAGDAERAAAAFESLLESNARASRNPKTWHALGAALRDAGRFDDAVDAFERGAFCADDGRANLDSNLHSNLNLNLPCLTSAAAEAARGGDAARARRLFARGSALASPEEEDAPSPFEPFEFETGADAAATSRNETGGGAERKKRAASSGFDARPERPPPRGSRASDFERSTHLRLWAAFEKRCGRLVTARFLFARASVANPADALVWLQWGQFENRAEGPDAARARFAAGVARVKRATKARAFLYQAWADLETNVGDCEAARAVYEAATAAHPASPELWLAFGAFAADAERGAHGKAGGEERPPSGEAGVENARSASLSTMSLLSSARDSRRERQTARACFARAATLAAGTAFARAVRDVRRAYGDLEEETGYPYGAAPGTHGEEGGFRDGSDDDARGFGPAEW